MRRERGFTLLEVMIALAIMALGLVSTLELLGGSMRLARASATQTEALLLARSLVDEALWRAEIRNDLTSGKEGRYTWTLEVRPIERQLIGLEEEPGLDFEDEDQDYELREVVVVVVWSEGSGSKSIELRTARLAEPERL